MIIALWSAPGDSDAAWNQLSAPCIIISFTLLHHYYIIMWLLQCSQHQNSSLCGVTEDFSDIGCAPYSNNLLLWKAGRFLGPIFLSEFFQERSYVSNSLHWWIARYQMCDYILNSETNSFNPDLMLDIFLGLSGALHCFISVPCVFPFRYFHTHTVVHSDNQPVYQSVGWNSYSTKLENL